MAAVTKAHLFSFEAIIPGADFDGRLDCLADDLSLGTLFDREPSLVGSGDRLLLSFMHGIDPKSPANDLEMAVVLARASLREVALHGAILRGVTAAAIESTAEEPIDLTDQLMYLETYRTFPRSGGGNK